jgi:hypothetical protein
MQSQKAAAFLRIGYVHAPDDTPRYNRFYTSYCGVNNRYPEANLPVPALHDERTSSNR